MNYDRRNKVEAIRNTEISEEDDEQNYDDYEAEKDFEPNSYEVVEESSTNNRNKDELKSKIIKYMGILIIVLIVLLLILFIISKFNTKRYTPEEVETIMKKAAESYFVDNPYHLPQNEKQTVEVGVDNLVAAGKMNPLQSYLGSKKNCSGKVQVSKSGSYYDYVPILICDGHSYTKSLVDSIISDENIVNNGYGLYKMDNNYVFRGENVNNYVQLDAELWRIIKVNSDKSIMLITDSTIGSSYPYDDRYNKEKDYDTGINNYQASRIKEQLDAMYNLTDKDKEYYILSEKDKNRLVNFDLCTGKMGKNDTAHNNSIECAQTMTTKIGLITISDFMNASIDSGCTTPISPSCKNYNYLADGTFWSVTASNENTYSAFSISDGVADGTLTSRYYKIRPVVTLSANTIITDGNGTRDNPYLIK